VGPLADGIHYHFTGCDFTLHSGMRGGPRPCI
jgi:hypothetical protein